MKKLLHPGNIILTGFGLMIIFMSYLVYSCTQHPSALVSDKYYEEELSFQKQIDARQQFDQLKQQISIDRTINELQVHFPDTLNRQVVQTKFTFYHVANSHKDFSSTLPQIPTGIYHFPIQQIAPGRYRVKMQIDGLRNQHFYHEITVTI